MITNKKEYIDAVNLLKEYSHAYYTLDNPKVTDEEYDLLYHKVKTYEANNPKDISLDSPTQKVGDVVVSSYSKINHINRMWSLDDIFTYEELKTWVNKIKSTYPNARFTCSPKFDGVSLNILYKNGILYSGGTRGDGYVGEDVTNNIKTIFNIPKTIPHKEDIEIRGEIVITKEDFYNLNKERLENNEQVFANPRNAAAGSIRQLDHNITAKRKLMFIPWGCGYSTTNNNSFYSIMEYIASLGFNEVPHIKILDTVDEIEEWYRHILEERDNFDMMLDGMVIMVDNIDTQLELGYTIKSPKFGCAYKFPATEKRTKLIAITNQIGRTGVITPVAELEPIEIDGVVVKRATLHNYKEIVKKDLMLLDDVIIIRSGDVIPKLIRPVKEVRDGGEIPITIPDECPSCKSVLEVEDIIIRCGNIYCPSRNKANIHHFVSKKGLNIEGLGYKILEQLLDNNIINNPLDIFKLNKDTLLSLEGFKDKKIENILKSIESSKECELWRFIYSLGIDNIGEWASKQLANTFGDKCFELSKEELSTINGFGDEMIKTYLDFVSKNKTYIDNLIDIIKPKITNTIIEDKRFNNKNIVITGTFEIPRDKLIKYIEERGGRVSSSVSKNTDLLLCGNNTGSKLEKANQLNIPIMFEKDI